MKHLRFFVMVQAVFLSIVAVAADSKEQLEHVADEINPSYQLIILMTSEAELKPRVINELIRSKNKNIYQEIGDVTKARHLISHRKKIGFADKTIDLSPEEIGKL